MSQETVLIGPRACDNLVPDICNTTTIARTCSEIVGKPRIEFLTIPILNVRLTIDCSVEPYLLKQLMIDRKFLTNRALLIYNILNIV